MIYTVILWYPRGYTFVVQSPPPLGGDHHFVTAPPPLGGNCHNIAGEITRGCKVPTMYEDWVPNSKHGARRTHPTPETSPVTDP